MPYHHLMDHRSFRVWPVEWNGQGTPRWAKCDYITTVSLDRCTDPYHREAYERRRYVKCNVIAADMTAIEKCILWALGITPVSDDPAADASPKTVIASTDPAEPEDMS